MNTEQLIKEAGTVIFTWQKTHNTGCQLYVQDGHVKAKSNKNNKRLGYLNLYIRRRNIIIGFTSAQWGIIGSSLLNLYNKELACQAHQKP